MVRCEKNIKSRKFSSISLFGKFRRQSISVVEYLVINHGKRGLRGVKVWESLMLVVQRGQLI
jgi:hypothetical protein